MWTDISQSQPQNPTVTIHMLLVCGRNYKRQCEKYSVKNYLSCVMRRKRTSLTEMLMPPATPCSRISWLLAPTFNDQMRKILLGIFAVPITRYC